MKPQKARQIGQLFAAVGAAAAGATAAMSAWARSWAAAKAADFDHLRMIGNHVGLTEEQTAEVIDVWRSRFGDWPWPDLYDCTRQALIDRALRKPWRPEEVAGFPITGRAAR